MQRGGSTSCRCQRIRPETTTATSASATLARSALGEELAQPLVAELASPWETGYVEYFHLVEAQLEVQESDVDEGASET